MKYSQMTPDVLTSLSTEEKWELLLNGIKDDKQTACIAILLGTIPQRAYVRAKACADLYNQKRVDYIIASGGVKWEVDGEKVSEADYMKSVLMSFGVPENVILLDNEARTTKENMICSTLVISRNFRFENVEDVIIVTEDFHMKRSLALAKAFLPRKFKISAYPAFVGPIAEVIKANVGIENIIDNALRLINNLALTRVIEDEEF